jgi:CheY-like chemotaxis protein
MSNQPTILVVDDNPTNQELAQQLLKVLGYSSLTASDGSQALALYRKESLAAILMDLNMPLMDGLTATRNIRNIEREEGKKRVPVVTWTASSGYTTEQDCLDAGMDDILSKPVDLEKMRTVLQRLAPLG